MWLFQTLINIISTSNKGKTYVHPSFLLCCIYIRDQFSLILHKYQSVMSSVLAKFENHYRYYLNTIFRQDAMY